MENVLRTPRIIWTAMMMGLLTFGGILSVVLSGKEPDPNMTFLLYIWAGLAVSQAIAYMTLRQFMIQAVGRRWRDRVSEDDHVELAPHWFVLWIIGAAMIEAAALFGLVIYMIARDPIALGCAGGCILLFGIWFPSKGMLRNYADAVMRVKAGPEDPHPR